jgi:5'-nucleotidase
MNNRGHIPADLASARILVTNDDGVHAEGLHALADVMRSVSDDVWIVAPETEQSGAGHSLTLHQPLRARELEPNRYAVSGTPTDCVLLGVQEILPDDKPVSLVVSGINHGDNVAENVTYSGTIAATMEATLLGIPAIAFSRAITDEGVLTWQTAQEAVRHTLRAFAGCPLNADTLLSVNIPDCPVTSLRGIRLAHQGQRAVHDAVDVRTDPRGRAYYWIGGTNLRDVPDDADSDCSLLQQNHITATPIALDMTNHGMLEAMRGHINAATHVSA